MNIIILGYVGGCLNYDPFLGSLNIRCRLRIGIQTGSIILTTTHVGIVFPHSLLSPTKNQ